MRLLLICLLLSTFAAAQPGYTPISTSRYNWTLPSRFSGGLHIPAGGNPSLGTGQYVGAGAVYVDTTGADAGLYYYINGAWVAAGSGVDSLRRLPGSLNVQALKGGTWRTQFVDSAGGSLGSLSTLPYPNFTVVQDAGGTTYKSAGERVFNVRDYGAVGDGSANDQTAIQAAINACYANGAGTVYFPNGIYKISGALVTNVGGYNPNSQLYIPQTRQANSSKTIIFRGESPPSYETQILLAAPVPTNGAIIYSTLTGTGSDPSILAGVPGNSGDAWPWNYTNVEIYNLGFRTSVLSGANDMSAINMNWCPQIQADNLRIDIDTTLPQSPSPASKTSRGFITPPNGNHLQLNLGTLYISGYHTGLVVNEHVNAKTINILGCYVGLSLLTGYHPVFLSMVQFEGCRTNIQFDGDLNVNIGTYATEHYRGAEWYSFNLDLNTSAGTSFVSIGLANIVNSNVGQVDSFLYSNGAGHEIFAGAGVGRYNTDKKLTTKGATALIFSTNGTQRGYIDQNDKVIFNAASGMGIGTGGTVTGGFKLDVGGSIKSSGGLTVTNGVTAGDAVSVTRGSSGDFFALSDGAAINGGFGINNTSGNESIYLFNNTNSAFRIGTNNNERMRISGGGNVGINDVSPSALFSVAGKFYTNSSGKFSKYDNTTPTNGKLLIGHTANGTFELGNIASANSSVTVTNNAGGIDLSVATPTESTYTPTLTNTSNVAASTAYAINYYQSGNTVWVWGDVSIDATAALTITEMGVSLPVASNFSSTLDLSGTATFEDNTTMQIKADATNDRAVFRGAPQTATNNRYSFTLIYKVIN